MTQVLMLIITVDSNLSCLCSDCWPGGPQCHSERPPAARGVVITAPRGGRPRQTSAALLLSLPLLRSAGPH